ncbi:MAG TPA: hypothetical protein P5121_18535, partial [Caldilineaceae bacterium]|nr:hypothetical protein [Caldilineaceae bacterium]
MRMIVWICVITCSAFSAFAAAQPVYAGLSPNRAAFRQTTPQPPSAPIHTANEAILARLNRPFTVGLRQWVTVTDTPEHFGLQLSALVSDSRCPAQVNCIVAGQAEFRLLLRRDDVVSPRTFQIGSYPTRDQNKVQFGEYVIELQAVEPPAPPPSQQLNPSDYRVTLLVRRSATPSPTPTTAATPTPTATTEPQDAPGADPMPRLGQPFIVRVGATASLTDIDFQLTLRSLSEDSGCLTATDCSVMTADGTLVLQQGDTRQLLTFITSMSAGQSFDYDFAGYVVRLLGVEVGRDGNQIATFVVERPMADVVIPEPERVMSCPSFSIFDAAAILQEEVEPRAIVNLVFGPIAPDAKTITGFCGYLAAAYDRAPTTSGTSPRIASDVSAVRGVIATIVK